VKVIGAHGADAVRLYLWGRVRSGYRSVSTNGRSRGVGRFLNTLRSTYDFFRRYAQDWNPPAEAGATPPSQRPAADRWLIAGSMKWSRVCGTHGPPTTRRPASGPSWISWGGSVALVHPPQPAGFWAPDRATDPVALETLHEALVAAVRMLAPRPPSSPTGSIGP